MNSDVNPARQHPSDEMKGRYNSTVAHNPRNDCSDHRGHNSNSPASAPTLTKKSGGSEPSLIVSVTANHNAPPEQSPRPDYKPALVLDYFGPPHTVLLRGIWGQGLGLLGHCPISKTASRLTEVPAITADASISVRKLGDSQRGGAYKLRSQPIISDRFLVLASLSTRALQFGAHPIVELATQKRQL